MSIPDINKLVDSRSRETWNRIVEKENVSLVFHDLPNYMCYTSPGNMKIYIARNNYNPDYFAHELLHIILKQKGIFINGHIARKFSENQELSAVFSNELIEHIGNTLEHIKMLDMYLKMGFERSEFIIDYNDPKCTDDEIQIIRTLINYDGGLWTLGADQYAGKFFAVKSCPNNTINYNKYLVELIQTDAVLYSILDTFWNGWLNFDIEKYDLLSYNYGKICDEFCDSLIEWVNNKKAGLRLACRFIS